MYDVGSVPGLGKPSTLNVHPVRLTHAIPVSIPLPADVLPVILAPTVGVPVTVVEKPDATSRPKRLHPPQFGAVIEFPEMVTLMLPETADVASAKMPVPSWPEIVLPLIVP